MNTERASRIIECVGAGLDGLVGAEGFQRAERNVRRDGRVFQRWVRRAVPWREDWVDTSHPLSSPELFLANVSTAAVLEDGRTVPLDGAAVASLAGRDRLLERKGLDRLRLAGDDEWLCARVLSDFRSALRWFDPYSTATGTLERLRSPLRNGVGVGTAIHDEVVSLVRRHSLARWRDER